jgi:TRAP-type mannitol/chloroaromatic compound transport system permease small subunit
MFLSFFILFLQSLAECFKSILILKGRNKKWFHCGCSLHYLL